MFSLSSDTRRLAAGLSVLAVAAGCLCFIPRSAAADGPTTAPAAKAQTDPLDDEFVIAKTRLQDMPAVNYLYASADATLTTLKDIIPKTMESLTDAIKAHKFAPAGPALFILHGMTADPDKKFTIEMGFPVANTAKPFDDFQVKKLAAFHCAAVLMSGPNRDVGLGWQAAYEDVMSSGLQPSDEAREEILKWQSDDSPNNVTLIELGVK